jgi:hypothetical protein
VTDKNSWHEELSAMQTIVDALKPLSSESQARILACVLILLDESISESAIRKFRR